MKRVITILLCAVLLLTGCPTVFAADSALQYNKSTETIRIRDPFVLVADGRYFMYGTGCASGKGYGCYVSEDLENWAGPFDVFKPTADFDGVDQFWAPECHEYKGNYYLFATYRSGTTGHRGVSIFRSVSPLGPFTEISDGHITPHDRDSIDGTLYVAPDGTPYMVYVNEWTNADNNDEGRMDVAKLSEDLTHFVSEPRELFRAKDPAWTNSKVTDGPFLYTTKTGRLLMLWSNVSKEGYCVGTAYSTNGTVDGKWKQNLSRLYVKDKKSFTLDGGHGMLFTDLDGNLRLCIHSPNNAENGRVETAAFFFVEDTGDLLQLHERPTFREYIFRQLDTISAWFYRIFA